MYGDVHNLAYVCGLLNFHKSIKVFKSPLWTPFPPIFPFKTLSYSSRLVLLLQISVIKQLAEIIFWEKKKKALNSSIFDESMHWVISEQTILRREIFRNHPDKLNNDSPLGFLRWCNPSLFDDCWAAELLGFIDSVIAKLLVFKDIKNTWRGSMERFMAS